MATSEAADEKKLGQVLLQSSLRHGDIITQRQFTSLVLEQSGIRSLTLITMAYMAPPGVGDSVARIHSHLLHLADEGTSVFVGIDNIYARFFAPHTDIPFVIAPFFMDRRKIKVEEARRARMYDELLRHKNVQLAFGGERFLPISIDHRKILCVRGSRLQDFAVIYGFNMDKTLDHEVDSAIYITQPPAVEWIDRQRLKKPNCPPERTTVGDLAFITREISWQGGRLADQEIASVIQGARESLLLCGQFIPDGPLLHHLIQASKRGISVNIISNGPSRSRQPMYLIKRKLVERKFLEACRTNSNISLYLPSDPTEFVHMKALIADIDNPRRARAITGTDNLSNRYRTREILVELLDYDHISRLHEYVTTNVVPNVRKVEMG